MSISILNRGASGGLKPELSVTAPAGSTIDLLQNGIIVNTWTLDEDKTEHTFVVRIGTYTARATLGGKSKSVAVVIDRVAQFYVEVSWVILSTDFSEKDQAWEETGGTFHYGDGLYVLSSDSKGTIVDGDRRIKQLRIPCKVNKPFVLEFSEYMYSTEDNMMGVMWLQGLDENGAEIFLMQRGDAWGGHKRQSIYRRIKDTVFVDPETLEEYNGKIIEYRLECTGNKIEWFEDGVSVLAVESAVVALDSIAIVMGGYDYANNPMPDMKIAYLQVEENV